MKKFKGTKGKFSVKKYESEVRIVKKKGGAIEDIVQVDFYLNDFSEAENLANAQLLASAPDLLEVCQDILDDDILNGILKPTDRIKLKKAINKALGL